MKGETAADETKINGGESRIPSTFRALKHRNFQLFFSGQFISLIGTWMQSVAQSWLVYSITGNVSLLGLIGFAGQMPVFLLTTFGGAVCIVGSLFFGRKLPSFRDEARRIIVALQMTGGVPSAKASFQEPAESKG